MTTATTDKPAQKHEQLQPLDLAPIEAAIKQARQNVTDANARRAAAFTSDATEDEIKKLSRDIEDAQQDYDTQRARLEAAIKHNFQVGKDRVRARRQAIADEIKASAEQRCKRARKVDQAVETLRSAIAEFQGGLDGDSSSSLVLFKELVSWSVIQRGHAPREESFREFLHAMGLMELNDFARSLPKPGDFAAAADKALNEVAYFDLLIDVACKREEEAE